MSLLDGIDKLVSDVAGELVFENAVLHQKGAPVTDEETGQTTAAATPSDVKALVTDYSAFHRGTLGIPDNERKILMLGHGAPVPKPGDRIAVGGYMWEIVNTVRDPAKATYELRSKPTGQSDG